jgi:hypothetical protein
MTRMAFNPTRAVQTALIVTCTFVALAGAQAAFAQGGARDAAVTAPVDGTAYSATLEQCATSTVPAERSATFTAQMVATSATQRMGMRIELQQRLRGEAVFHTVIASGLGVWRASEPGVKIYKYVKQVTNLTAPAAYRAVVHFRWVGDKGRVLKHAELHTPRCLQPMLPAQVKQALASTPVA